MPDQRLPPPTLGQAKEKKKDVRGKNKLLWSSLMQLQFGVVLCLPAFLFLPIFNFVLCLGHLRFGVVCHLFVRLRLVCNHLDFGMSCLHPQSSLVCVSTSSLRVARDTIRFCFFLLVPFIFFAFVLFPSCESQLRSGVTWHKLFSHLPTALRAFAFSWRQD